MRILLVKKDKSVVSCQLYFANLYRREPGRRRARIRWEKSAEVMGENNEWERMIKIKWK